MIKPKKKKPATLLSFNDSLIDSITCCIYGQNFNPLQLTEFSLTVKLSLFFYLRRLDGHHQQQTNHQICVKFYDKICLALIYYLVKKKIHIFKLLDLVYFPTYFLELFFERRSK